MLKPFTVHPSSVLLGLGLAAMLALVSGATQSVGSTRPVPVEQQIIGHIPASWWTSVEVRYDPAITYVVPADRYLVVTFAGYGANDIRVDGQYFGKFAPVLETAYGTGDDRPDGDTRVVLPPGSVLSMSSGWPTGDVMLWGYLEPAN